MAEGFLYIPDLKRAGQLQIWFRYSQDGIAEPKIEVRDAAGDPSTSTLHATIDGLGDRPEGEYTSRSRAIFWDRIATAGPSIGNPLPNGGPYTVLLYLDSVYTGDKMSFFL